MGAFILRVQKHVFNSGVGVFLDYPLGEIVLEAYRTRCHEGTVTAGSGSSFFQFATSDHP